MLKPIPPGKQRKKYIGRRLAMGGWSTDADEGGARKERTGRKFTCTCDLSLLPIVLDMVRTGCDGTIHM